MHLYCSTHVGKNLKLILNEKNITQVMFAEKIGFSERQVRNWIKNGVNNVDNLLLIQRTLGLESILVLLKKC
ncbi:MAG: helix-turn-helix domain-containing protein [Anaeroplasmataceae bacterium]